MRLLILLFLLSSFVRADDFSSYHYLVKFRDSYLKNSPDPANFKQLHKDHILEMARVICKYGDFKNPAALKQPAMDFYNESKDEYMREFVYNFLKLHKFTDIQMTLARAREKKTLNFKHYPVLARLFQSKVLFHNNMTSARIKKKVNDVEVDRFFKDILEAAKKKGLNRFDREFIIQSIHKLLSDIAFDKPLVKKLWDRFSSDGEVDSFLLSSFEIKMEHVLMPNKYDFKGAIKKSYNLALKLYEKYPDYPSLTYHLMFCTALLKKDKKQFDDWFEKTIQLRPKHNESFLKYTQLTHKQYSDQDLEKCFEMCMNQDYKTYIPGVLISHAFHMIKHHYDKKFGPIEEFYDQYLHEVFKNFEKLNDAGKYIDETPYRFHERHFLFAFKLKKYKHVLVLDQKYGQHLKQSYYLKSKNINYSDAIAEAKLRRSNVSEIFKDITQTISRNGGVKSDDDLRVLRKEIHDFKNQTPDENLQERFKILLSLLDLKEKFLSYKKIKFDIDDKLTQWNSAGRRVSGVSQMKRIYMESAGNSKEPLRTFCKVAFEPPYEISFGLNLSAKNYLDRPSPMGLLLGDSHKTKEGISFWIDRSKSIYGIYVNGQKILENNKKFPPTTQLKVIVDKENQCTFFMGKKKLLVHDCQGIDLSQIGFGVPGWDIFSDMAIFQTPTIKRLK